MERHHSPAETQPHSHVFLGVGHEKNERKTWAVIILCSVMMVVEIVGGSVFGSLALIADGWHMSTHAGDQLMPTSWPTH
jgi:Co/Zn/Cd efflux system component